MTDIVSERLILRLLPVEALNACAANDLAGMSRAIGLDAPASWSEMT